MGVVDLVAGVLVAVGEVAGKIQMKHPMKSFTVKILAARFITHDVKRFVTEKPEGFTFKAGQNVMLALHIPGRESDFRPFTFTSLPDWPYLEFIIKIYDDHNGVTKELGKTNAGGEFILRDVFGTITYKGPGVFLAGGAGITPFISIFRALYLKGGIHKSKLILSNKSSEDIILPYELYGMLGKRFINVFTRQGVIGYRDRRIDRKMLIMLIADFSGNFYVCGSREFVDNIMGYLVSLGANAHSLIFEERNA